MAISLYDISIPSFVRGLTNLSSLLDKADAFAVARKFDPSILVHERLFADMHSLARQVQIVCDTAKGAAGRLAAIEIPKHEDSEATLAELKARIAKTIDFVKTVQSAQLKDAESRSIVLQFPNRSMTFTGLKYLTDFVLPNFYFHISIAYALLRTNGVEVGKADFLGAIQ